MKDYEDGEIDEVNTIEDPLIEESFSMMLGTLITFTL